MIFSEWIYWVAGLFFAGSGIAILTEEGRERKAANALFWILLGVGFVYAGFVPVKGASALGPTLPAAPLGVLVIALAVIAGLGLTGRGNTATTTDEQREGFAARFGNKLFIPALTIPLVTVLVATALAKIEVNGAPLFQKGTETIQGLTIGCLVALVVALIIFRVKTPVTPMHEGRRLLEAIGWAVLLPQMLSTLGTLFNKAGVGSIVGEAVKAITPEDSRFVAVIIYAVGMFVFTAIMGNAFAAFPIMTAAIGWPVLVESYGAAPAPMFALAMLAGFSGTLVTPMAANFNIVPAALLEMKDQHGPIKAQVPTAIIMLVINIAFMAIFPWL